MKYITILVFCFFYRGMCVLGTGGDRKIFSACARIRRMCSASSGSARSFRRIFRRKKAFPRF